MNGLAGVPGVEVRSADTIDWLRALADAYWMRKKAEGDYDGVDSKSRALKDEEGNRFLDPGYYLGRSRFWK